MRIPISALIGAAALSLSACATAGPYDGGGLYAGSAYGSPYSCGTDGLYYGYGTYGLPGCGWYNGYFYPGSGGYMYDSNRGQHVWNGGQRPYSGPARAGSSGGVRIGGGTSGFGGVSGFGGMRGFGGGGSRGGSGGRGH